MTGSTSKCWGTSLPVHRLQGKCTQREQHTSRRLRGHLEVAATQEVTSSAHHSRKAIPSAFGISAPFCDGNSVRQQVPGIRSHRLRREMCGTSIGMQPHDAAWRCSCTQMVTPAGLCTWQANCTGDPASPHFHTPTTPQGALALSRLTCPRSGRSVRVCTA